MSDGLQFFRDRIDEAMIYDAAQVVAASLVDGGVLDDYHSDDQEYLTREGLRVLAALTDAGYIVTAADTEEDLMSDYGTKENPTTRAGLPKDRTKGNDPSGVNVADVRFALEALNLVATIGVDVEAFSRGMAVVLLTTEEAAANMQRAMDALPTVDDIFGGEDE